MAPGKKFLQFVEKLNVPVFDTGSRAGNTDYIDFIRPGEIDHQVMKGVDAYSRPFLIIKAVGKLEDGGEINLFQTFFQRYTGEKELWMGCGNYGNQLFDTCGGMKKSHFTALKDLINGKTISTEGFYRSDSHKVTHFKLEKPLN